MMMKTPKFWLKKNLIARLLLPFSALYFVIYSILNLFKKEQKVAAKIICVGNVTLGGSGKTPVAMALGEALQKMGVNFAYLSRGHRSKERNLTQVDLKKSTALDVGDEPLLLANVAPTYIAKNRFLAACEILAKNDKIQAFVLDDGMQNKSLKKDFVILVVDGKIKFGNEFLFPAGPLRQGITSGLKKADLVVVIGEIDDELRDLLAKKNVVLAKIIAKNLAEFEGQKLLGFCGLAYPQKFFDFCEKQGLNLVRKIEFADHYFYSENDLISLQKIAKENGAKLITTKKDWVKFSPKWQKEIGFLDISLEFKNEELVKKKILEIFK